MQPDDPILRTQGGTSTPQQLTPVVPRRQSRLSNVGLHVNTAAAAAAAQGTTYNGHSQGSPSIDFDQGGLYTHRLGQGYREIKFGGDLQLLCPVGMGQFGTVFKANWVIRNRDASSQASDTDVESDMDDDDDDDKEYREVAAKCIHPRGVEGFTADQKASFVREITVLSHLSHPHILKFLGACVTDDLILISEFCDAGSLYDFLHNEAKSGECSLSFVHRIALEIAEGTRARKKREKKEEEKKKKKKKEKKKRRRGGRGGGVCARERVLGCPL